MLLVRSPQHIQTFSAQWNEHSQAGSPLRQLIGVLDEKPIHGVFVPSYLIILPTLQPILRCCCLHFYRHHLGKIFSFSQYRFETFERKTRECNVLARPAGDLHYKLLYNIEWFSFECRKTKTKVITLANHIGHRQYIEPIKTRSNYMWLTQSAGKCMRARHNWLWFYF